MTNSKQTGFGAAAGVCFALILLFRILALIDVFKVIKYIGSYYDPGWKFWVAMLMDIGVAVCMLGATYFLFTANIRGYGNMAIAVGTALAIEYGSLLIWTLSAAGRYAGSLVFNWRMILIYGSMALFCFSFIHSGRTAKRLDDGERVWNKWLTATLSYVSGLLCIWIATLGTDASLSDLLASDTQPWKTYVLLFLNILALLMVGLHLKERDAMNQNSGRRVEPPVHGVPAYNSTPYAPFTNPVQGQIPYQNSAPQGGYTPPIQPYQGQSQPLNQSFMGVYAGMQQGNYTGAQQQGSYAGQYGGAQQGYSGAQQGGYAGQYGGTQQDGYAGQYGGTQQGSYAGQYSGAQQTDHGQSDSDPYQGYFRPTDSDL